MIELYTWSTSNGRKVSIALEEMGFDYRVHPIDIGAGEQFAADYTSRFPNAKIPAIIDGETGVSLFESGAILIYLAEKTGQFLPEAPARRYEVLQWLMFQMGGIGPMFGQLGFFHFAAGKEIEDPRPKERYRAEVARLLRVLDGALDGRDWIVEDYSIADIAICPWLRTLRETYKATAITGWNDLENVPAYLERFLARPAVQRGLTMTPAT